MRHLLLIVSVLSLAFSAQGDERIRERYNRRGPARPPWPIEAAEAMNNWLNVKRATIWQQSNLNAEKIATMINDLTGIPNDSSTLTENVKKILKSLSDRIKKGPVVCSSPTSIQRIKSYVAGAPGSSSELQYLMNYVESDGSPFMGSGICLEDPPTIDAENPGNVKFHGWILNQLVSGNINFSVKIDAQPNVEKKSLLAFNLTSDNELSINFGKFSGILKPGQKIILYYNNTIMSTISTSPAVVLCAGNQYPCGDKCCNYVPCAPGRCCDGTENQCKKCLPACPSCSTDQECKGDLAACSAKCEAKPVCLSAAKKCPNPALCCSWSDSAHQCCTACANKLICKLCPGRCSPSTTDACTYECASEPTPECVIDEQPSRCVGSKIQYCQSNGTWGPAKSCPSSGQECRDNFCRSKCTASTPLCGTGPSCCSPELCCFGKCCEPNQQCIAKQCVNVPLRP